MLSTDCCNRNLSFLQFCLQKLKQQWNWFQLQNNRNMKSLWPGHAFIQKKELWSIDSSTDSIMPPTITWTNADLSLGTNVFLMGISTAKCCLSFNSSAKLCLSFYSMCQVCSKYQCVEYGFGLDFLDKRLTLQTFVLHNSEVAVSPSVTASVQW